MFPFTNPDIFTGKRQTSSGAHLGCTQIHSCIWSCDYSKRTAHLSVSHPFCTSAIDDSPEFCFILSSDIVCLQQPRRNLAKNSKCISWPYRGGLVVFSPDGTRIASASHDETIRVWDSATGVRVAGPFHFTDFVWSISFFPDGKQIVFSFAAKVQVWNLETFTCTHNWTFPQNTGLCSPHTACSLLK